LASFASAAASILPIAIAKFRRRHPIEISVVMADPIESFPMLRAGELDFAISHDPMGGLTEELGATAFDLVHLFDDPMYVALPVGHPLADGVQLDLARLAEEPWMLATTNSCPDSKLFLRACHAAGFEPRIAFQNDDYPAILGFVAAGVGVALVPDMVARGVRDDVVIRALEPPAPSRPIFAAFAAGYRSPAAAAILDVFREVSETWVSDRPVLSAA
jgi:DNA-binding transcriptional LysR family regulator